MLNNQRGLPEDAFRLAVESLSPPSDALELTGRSIDPAYITSFADAGYTSGYAEIFNCEPRYMQEETVVCLPLRRCSGRCYADSSNLLMLEQRCQELCTG